MAAEVIGADGVRIKYAARRLGRLQLVAAPEPPVQLHALSALMHRLEACGMLPVLSDGLVGGNAAIAATACRLEPGTGGWEPAGSAPATADGSSQPQSPSGAILISRSGKQPGVPLLAADWVLLSSFDPSRWAVDYRSAEEAARPSSDAPLHAAALGPAAAQRYGWAAAPLVAVHGHALAEGEGLERARAAGLPISERETLFSTPEDLEELELLFRSHPYPHHCCYIRRGHGFLLLTASVEEAEEHLRQHILPLSGATWPGWPTTQPSPAICTIDTIESLGAGSHLTNQFSCPDATTALQAPITRWRFSCSPV